MKLSPDGVESDQFFAVETNSAANRLNVADPSVTGLDGPARGFAERR
jgi:hypothetical protein